jgi:hypothetical protein
LIKKRIIELDRTTGFFSKILGLNREYSQYNRQLKKLIKERNVSKDFVKKNEKELKTHLRKHLTKNNVEYQLLLTKAREILAGNVVFDVYEKETNSSDLPAKTTELKGQLYNKKSLLVRSTKTTLSNYFPKYLKGKIDPYGRIQLKSTPQMDIGSLLVSNFISNRTPSRYVGKIKPDGSIYLKAENESNDFFVDKNIKKMICNPFENNQEKVDYMETISLLKGLEKSSFEEL